MALLSVARQTATGQQTHQTKDIGSPCIWVIKMRRILAGLKLAAQKLMLSFLRRSQTARPQPVGVAATLRWIHYGAGRHA